MKTRLFQIARFTFLAGALALTVTGCRKWIEVEAESEFGIGETFSSVANATSAVLGVYDELSGDNGYGTRIPHHYANDNDETITSGNLDNGRRGLGRYDLKAGNSELIGPFEQLYRGVEKANLCIEQIPLMAGYSGGSPAEQAQLRRLHGEALTLRAQFLFELMRTWGDVPAPFQPSYQQKDLFLQKSNRDTVYDRLIADLATAKALLPWKPAGGPAPDERITKGAAMALRARLALYRGGYALRRETNRMERRADFLKYYQITREETAELMNAENRRYHTLNPDYENIFRNIHADRLDPYGEILFEVGMTGQNSTSDSKLGRYDGPRTDAASRYGAAGGGINVLPNYFYAFDSVDKRRDVTITYYSIDATNTKALVRLTQLTNGKFRRDWRSPLLPGDSQFLGYNWPLIRFSDVLLMFAEADNEINNGPTPAAIAAFEEVRRRGFAGNESKMGVTPRDKNGFFEALVKERSLEFGSEGIRKFDLIRWNMLGSRLTATRASLEKIARRSDEWAFVPRYMYYRNNPLRPEEIEIFGSFYSPTPATAPTPAYNATTAPFGWRRVNWAEEVNTARVDNLPFFQTPGRLFTPNRNELYPFPTTVLESYNGLLTQDYGY